MRIDVRQGMGATGLPVLATWVHIFRLTCYSKTDRRYRIMLAVSVSHPHVSSPTRFPDQSVFQCHGADNDLRDGGRIRGHQSLGMIVL